MIDENDAEAEAKLYARMISVRLGRDVEAHDPGMSGDLLTFRFEPSRAGGEGEPEFHGLQAPSGLAVCDPATGSAVIRTDGGDHIALVRLGEMPDRAMSLVFVRVTDEDEFARSWSEGCVFRDPDGDPGARLVSSVRRSGDRGTICIEADVRDPQLLCRTAREMRQDVWGDGESWVPASLSEAIFEIAMASSDAPSPDSCGYEIVSAGPDDESAPDVIRTASRDLRSPELHDGLVMASGALMPWVDENESPSVLLSGAPGPAIPTGRMFAQMRRLSADPEPEIRDNETTPCGP